MRGAPHGLLAASNLDGHEHVLERRQRWQQVEELEDEPNPRATQFGQPILIQRRNLHALDDDATARRRVETRDEAEQRGLAPPDGPVIAIARPLGTTRSVGCRMVNVPAPLGTDFVTPLSSITRSLPSDRGQVSEPTRRSRR
jgi:hypothetical protein